MGKLLKSGCLVLAMAIFTSCGSTASPGFTISNTKTTTPTASTTRTTNASPPTSTYTTATSVIPQTSTTTATTPSIWIKPGMYRVGNDIPAGEYVLQATSAGNSSYFEIASDSSGQLSSIIYNGSFYNTSIITVTNGQYLTINRCDAAEISKAPNYATGKEVLPEGMYKVGLHIPAGEYILTATSESRSGYFCVYSSSVQTLANIVANGSFNGNRYITIRDGQYIEVNRATLQSVAPSTSTALTATAQSTIPPPSTMAAFEREKAQAVLVNYSELCDNPASHTGQKLYFRGALLQIVLPSLSSAYTLRAGTDSLLGFNEDVLLTYAGGAPSLVPWINSNGGLNSNYSYIEFVAIMRGMESYVTTNGSMRTIPRLEVVQLRTVTWPYLD